MQNLIIIVAFFVVTSPMILLGEVDRCQWVEVELCSILSGKRAGPITIDGFDTDGKGTFRINQISGIIKLESINSCVLVDIQGPGQAAVMGSYEDMLNRLSPEGCDDR